MRNGVYITHNTPHSCGPATHFAAINADSLQFLILHHRAAVIDKLLTPKERRQIMGNRSDVYEQYYMPNFTEKDCLAIYLGTIQRDDLVRAVGRPPRTTQPGPRRLEQCAEGRDRK